MLNSTSILVKTRKLVKDKLEKEGSGHDWWHVYRVWQMAKRIAKEERADLLTVELAALLHDIADWKFHQGDEEIGPKTAQLWLQRQGVTKEKIDQIGQIIRTISFKGAKVKAYPMKTIEGKIVQDADRLDAMGAIGIARTFTFGGYKGRPLWDPNIRPTSHTTSQDYLKNSHNTVNHFYEKLLLLKDRMNTKSAKIIAVKRHQIMEKFLQSFYNEWEGRE